MDSAEHGAGREKSRHTSLKTDCEGFIAVTALIIMAILLMIGVAFLSMATTENTMVANEVNGQAAFNIAEAGIEHARRALLVPGTNLTTVIQNNQTTPFLNQVSFGGGGTYYTVRITNNCDPAAYSNDSRCTKLAVPAASPPVSLDTGGPTSDTDNRVVATSQGWYRRCTTCPWVTRTIQAMIERPLVNANLKGTLTANTSVKIDSASAVIDGKNYDCSGQPAGTDNNFSAVTAPASASTPCPPGAPTNICAKGTNNLQCDGGTGTTCTGSSPSFPDSIGALLLPSSSPQWQIDAMNAYLERIKIDPVAHPEQLPTSASDFNRMGIVYVDGCYASPPNGSTGILIVHHRYQNGQNSCGNPSTYCTNAGGCDAAVLGNVNAGTTFNGLIIADRINKFNGGATILGGVFAFGNGADGVTVDDVEGTPAIRYSQCALDRVRQDLPSWIVPGTWHEL